MPDRPILLIQCPSCQHENTPGERFCAVCGVPLHLKLCPECGKVDEAAAQSCSSCGAAFPSLSPDQFRLAEEVAPAGRQADPSPVDSVVQSAPANRPWPLFIVALVAGGIPFLWMYRANMPMPKAWQVQGPNAAGSAAIASPVAPAAQPLVMPPPASLAGQKDQASVAEPAQDKPSEAAAPTTQTPPAAQAKAVPPRHPPANPRPVAKPVAKTAPAGAVGAGSTPSRPCTEALAALGLCDPKSTAPGK